MKVKCDNIMKFYLAERKRKIAEGRKAFHSKESLLASLVLCESVQVALRVTFFGLTEAMRLGRTIPGKPTDRTHGNSNVTYFKNHC